MCSELWVMARKPRNTAAISIFACARVNTRTYLGLPNGREQVVKIGSVPERRRGCKAPANGMANMQGSQRVFMDTTEVGRSKAAGISIESIKYLQQPGGVEEVEYKIARRPFRTCFRRVFAERQGQPGRAFSMIPGKALLPSGGSVSRSRLPATTPMLSLVCQRSIRGDLAVA